MDSQSFLTYSPHRWALNECRREDMSFAPVVLAELHGIDGCAGKELPSNFGNGLKCCRRQRKQCVEACGR